MTHLLAALLSLGIGLSLGLLGGGGSTLTTPMLVYALGVERKEAIASSLLVVGTTSAFAALMHARNGNLDLRTGLLFGAAGMTGAWIGGRLAAFVPAGVLMLMFAGMMVATSVAMFRGRRGGATAGKRQSLARIVPIGVAAGVATGLVGAGGGFVIVPALVLLGGLDMRRAVGTSLLVIALQAFAGFLGHAGHVDVDFVLVALVCVAAVGGALLGSMLQPRVHPERLRRGFAVFVLAMAALVLYQEVPRAVTPAAAQHEG